MEKVDISSNRQAAKWSRSELLGRLLWETIGVLAFRLSPRPFWGWRRAVLRLFGAKIGSEAHLYPTVRLAVPWNLQIGDQAAIGDGARLYNLGPILIGERATISQYAHLCAGTHDHRQADMRLLKLPIVIKDDSWICADAYIGPGVTVGAMAIVGARAVAVKDVPARSIVGGNPARVIGHRGGTGE